MARHPIFESFIYDLKSVSDQTLENAVDQLIVESQSSWGEFDGATAQRAEALAIIGHEMRRRANLTKEAD